MSASTDPPELDLRVKGSLPGGSSSSSSTLKPPPLPPTNPLDTAPSSPSQIYLNLLILEASLRSQYLHHLARRRKFTFFLVLLFLWSAFFCYRIFVAGGSPYFYVHLTEKLGFGGGVVTGVLYYATGLYQKTIVEPRRFVFIANRGLRGFNVKLVKVHLSYREWISWWWSWYTFRPPLARAAPSTAKRRLSSNVRRPPAPIPSHASPTTLSSLALNRSLSPHQEEDDEEEVEEYLPGGLHIKLVILPKGFSPDFREGWEIYRTEFWGKENETRQVLCEEAWKRSRAKQEERPTGPERKMRRGSRSGSVSSNRGRTPTPEPEAVPSSRARRGSTASLKRRPHAGGLRAGTPGDISDSGSTTSALGERMKRSESTRTDRSSSSTGSVDGKKKGGARSKGKKPAGGAIGSAGGGSDVGEPSV